MKNRTISLEKGKPQNCFLIKYVMSKDGILLVEVNIETK